MPTLDRVFFWWIHFLLIQLMTSFLAYMYTTRILWAHYENTPIQIYWKFHHQKNENFQMKNSDIFLISAQNIDCVYSLEPPRWGGSNGYPQSMFLSRNKKNNVYPCKPQFYYIKVGFKGVKIIKACFRDVRSDVWQRSVASGNIQHGQKSKIS